MGSLILEAAYWPVGGHESGQHLMGINCPQYPWIYGIDADIPSLAPILLLGQTTMGFDTKEDLPADATKDIEEIELAEPLGFKHPTDLSGIESTAASRTAWLISIVVSIGGLLFGWSLERPCIRHL